MIKLINNILILLLLYSCEITNTKKITTYVKEKKEIIKENLIVEDNDKSKNTNIFYYIGEPYYIQGVEYIPEENYNYTQIGLATFYDKEIHNIKTINNDLNKVTELLGRHKTLPIPSTVKITNLENGLSLVIKINDRHNDNSSIIQVSRKVAQLLRFYRNKIARVKVEILPDASKQMKIVAQNMNEINFETTVESAPTEVVTITDLNEISDNTEVDNSYIDQPIELGYEKINEANLYLKVYNFDTHNEIINIADELNIDFNITSKKQSNKFIMLIGPIENEDANNLVSSFISKGYKKTEIVLE